MAFQIINQKNITIDKNYSDGFNLFQHKNKVTNQALNKEFTTTTKKQQSNIQSSTEKKEINNFVNLTLNIKKSRFKNEYKDPELDKLLETLLTKLKIAKFYINEFNCSERKNSHAFSGNSSISKFESSSKKLSNNYTSHSGNNSKTNESSFSMSPYLIITEYLTKNKMALITTHPYLFCNDNSQQENFLKIKNSYKLWIVLICFFVIEGFTMEDVLKVFDYALTETKSNQTRIFEFGLIIFSECEALDLNELEYYKINNKFVSMYFKYKDLLLKLLSNSDEIRTSKKSIKEEIARTSKSKLESDKIEK